MNRLLVLTLLAVAALTAVSVAGAESVNTSRFMLQGTVTSVVDGDTVHVRVAGGKRERVRLIGIDTPERGTCYADQATAAARRLAQGKRVTLEGDVTQARRDRYNRLLAYVRLPGGRDLGAQLIRGGFAEVYVYNRPFRQLSAYKSAERTGRTLVTSVWTCGAASAPPAPAPAAPAPPPAAPTPSPSGACHPSYADACLDPSVSDYDCIGGSGNGPGYTAKVRVVGPDVYRLDSNGDGYGCE